MDGGQRMRGPHDVSPDPADEPDEHGPPRERSTQVLTSSELMPESSADEPTRPAAWAAPRDAAPTLDGDSPDARLEALYRAHGRALYRFLLRLTFGQRQAAEDL